MKRAISLLFVAFALTGGALGQSGRFAYLARYQYTGTSGKATLQIPAATTGKTARLIEIYVSCPTATCDVVFTVGGGLATATGATTYRLRSRTPASSPAVFFTGSNATGGTALPAIPLPAGYAGTLEAQDFEIITGEALSITVSSSSQVVTIVPKWETFDTF